MGDPRKAESARPPAVTRPAIRRTGAPPEELPRYSLPALAPPPARVDDDGEQTRAFETGEQATRMFEAERPTNQLPSQPAPKVKLPTPSGPPQSPWARPSGQLPSPDTDRQLARLDEDDDLNTSPAHLPPRFSSEEPTMSRSDLLIERPAPRISDDDWNQTLTAVPRERPSSPHTPRPAHALLDPVSESEVLSTGDFQLRTSHLDDDEVTRGAIELPSKPVMPAAKVTSAAPAPRASTPSPPPSRPPPRRAPAVVEPLVPEPVITAPILEAPPSNRPLAQARTQPVQAEDPYAAYRNAQAAAGRAPSYAPPTPAFTPVAAAARTAPPTSRAATPRSGVAKADSPRYLLWIAYGLLVGGFGVLFGAQFITSKPEEEAAPTKPSATAAQTAAQTPPAQPGAMPMQQGVMTPPGAMPMQQGPGSIPMQQGPGMMPQGAYPQYGQQVPQGAMPQGAYPQYGQQVPQGVMPQGAYPPSGYPNYGQQPAQPAWGQTPQQPAPQAQAQKSHTTVATRPAAPAAPRTPKAPDEAPHTEPKTPAKGSAAAADILGDGL